MSEKSRKALELALAGGDPIGFLKEEGSKNPSAAWHSIKMQLKKKDPEKWAKIPNLRTAKEPEAQEPDLPEDALGRSAEILEKFMKPATQKPDDGFEKIEIRSTDSGMIYKRAEGGMTMILDGKGIFLNERTWKQLAEEIPKALKTLGVDS